MIEVRTPLLSDPSLYIDRDLSLLEFQRRVLEQAQDAKTPLLERVKFLAIFGSNMDELFMLRVSSLHWRMSSNGKNGSSQSLSGELMAIRALARELYATALQCLHQELVPKLEKTGIRLLDYSNLTKHQKERVYNYFKENHLSPIDSVASSIWTFVSSYIQFIFKPCCCSARPQGRCQTDALASAGYVTPAFPREAIFPQGAQKRENCL